MKKFFANRGLHFLLLSLLLAAALGLRYTDPKPVERLRHIAFDAYNRLMPRLPGDEITIIDIDEESLRHYGQWPWPRTDLAAMVEKLTALGAKAIVFDIVFAEEDRTSPRFVLERLKDDDINNETATLLKDLPDNDIVFAQSLKESGKAVTAFVWTKQPTKRAPILKAKIFNTGYKPDPEKFVASVPFFATNLPIIAGAAAGNGSFSMFPEQDGLIRRVPLLVGHSTAGGVHVYPALALEALRVAFDKKVIKIESYGVPTEDGYGITSITVGDYTIPTDSQGNFRVYYSGHQQNRYIPAWKLLSDQASSRQIKNKIVLIGTSAIGLLDLRSTPLDPVIPGVEVHAEIIEQVLNRQFMKRPGFFDGAEIIVTGVIGLTVIFLAPFIGTISLAGLVFALMIAGFSFAVYAFDALGFLIDAVYPAITVTVIFILASIFANLRSESERRMIKNAFGHYISKDLMNELTKDPDRLRLGGETRELTVIFTDVRNFTTISEALTPEELIQLMNDFLTPMTSIIMEERGTVDKYMGDAMMAFWNAPLDVPDHALHGCRAALRMADALRPINAALEEKAIRESRQFHEMRTGIGIATGSCSVGNMGAKQRFAYSALGDSVNLAARLESQTKTYGVPIMTSESTQKAAAEFAFLELDLLQVKGKTKPERVFALIGDEDFAVSDEFKNMKIRHDKMLAAYRERVFQHSADLCDELKAHPLAVEMAGFYALMRKRSENYLKSPPPADWNGVYIAETK